MKRIQLLLIAGLMSLSIISCQKQDADLSPNPLSQTEKIHSIKIDSSTVLVKEQNGKYYLADDIILTPEQFAYLNYKAKASDSSTTTPRAGVVSQFIRTWPNGVVPYVINPSFPDQDRIHNAISYYHANTIIQFVPRSNQTDYVEFVVHDPTTAYSNVGRIGGRQYINIGTAFQTGNVMHEIGHAIGFVHEHSRPDRDNYIDVFYSNIPNGTSNVDFQKYPSSEIINIGPFDFNSIMLYRSDSGVGGSIAMRRKDGSTWDQQRSYLSSGDLNGINYLYLPFILYLKTSSEYEIYEQDSSGSTDNFVADNHITVHFFSDENKTIPMTLPAYTRLRFRIRVNEYGSGPENLYSYDTSRDYIVPVNSASHTITLPYRYYNYLGYFQPSTYFESLISVERIR